MYINETLVCGLSASTYPDLVRQRDRWCRGNLQVLKNFRKTIFKKLKPKQKIIYIDGVLYWFTGLVKLTYIITPIIYMLTGIVIVNLPPTYLFPLFLLAFIGQLLISKLILPKEISKHYFSFFMKGEFYHTIIAPHLAFSVLKHFFFSDMKFSVTSKKVSSSKGKFYFKLSFCHIILLISSIASLIVGTINLGSKIAYDPYFINLFWILYNIPGLLISLKIAYQPPRQFANEGIPISNYSKVKINFENNEITGQIIEASEEYLSIKLDNSNTNFKNNHSITLYINDASFECVIKNHKENIINVKYKNLSYFQMSHIMDILLPNLAPYKSNLKL